MNNFDYYKNIILKTGEVKDLTGYEVFGFNNILSFDPFNFSFSEAMNHYPFIDKKLSYLFYYYGIDKRKKVPFLNIKKNKNKEWEELKDIAQRIFIYMNLYQIKEIFELVKDDLKRIKKIEDNKGFNKKEVKK